MYSFHLASSPWFLLLIPPGLWILWRAYAGGARRGMGRVLFALQSAALILLAFSLAGPELRRHHVRFHNPSILVLRDQSASFRAGATLGLGGRYADFGKRLGEAYADRKFEVRVADFAASAWPVSGFPQAPRPPGPAPGDPTSLAAAADFADSAAIPNLQAVFLFSDGRAVLDSGRAARPWRVPVFPVVFPPDSISEAQPLAVSRDEAGVSVRWEPIGRSGGEARLRLLRGNRVAFERKLPSAGPPAADGSRSVRFPWTPPAGSGPLRAVIEPAAPADNFDPWNDTLPLAEAGSAGSRVFVLKPLRSLDEKGMLDALRAEGNLSVTFFAAGEAASLAPGPRDQVWAEAGALAEAGLAGWLRTQPGKAVIYARAADEGAAGAPARPPAVPGLAAEAWETFSPSAEIKPSKAAADAFPADVVRIKSLTSAPLRAPPLPARGAGVEAREAGKRGMLMGRIDLGGGKRAFFFCLPAIWAGLFDPQADFSVRENIGAYVRAAHALAGMDEGRARVSLPRRAIAGIPFAADIELPEGAKGDAAFGLSGGDFAREWGGPASAGGGWSVQAIALPAGRYRAWVRAGADTLWRDSLEAAPREALELARLGFDAAALSDLAERSGGAVIRPAGGEVTSLLPSLAAAQVRMDRMESFRLYNTLPLGLAIFALLALSWFLRKKWDFD